MAKTYTTPGGYLPAFCVELESQTHILIAGATGSGKSVAINTLIHGLLLDLPRDVGLVLIDPKRVELSPFRSVPHCLGYASEQGEIDALLRRVVATMEERYTSMQRRGLRKWDGGHIWVIVDEFADLMVTSKKTCKPLLMRIAQLGRACGVHLVIATQRPTRDIISGDIKVNLDCRLALHCPTAQDSRNIIDRNGAETLPAYGQGILRRPSGELVLYDIPYTPDTEIYARIDYWRRQLPLWRRFSA